LKICFNNWIKYSTTDFIYRLKKANKLKEEGKKGIRIYIQSLSSYFNYRVNKAKIAINDAEIEEYIFLSC
jgi:hypothetical protein